METLVKKPTLGIYPEEISNSDIIGDADFAERIYPEFGGRVIRGSAAGLYKVNGQIIRTESIYRKFLNDIDINMAVEIGTWRGLSTAILAHYANGVVTIDITAHQVSWFLWVYAGVESKIMPVIIESEDEKRQICENLDFDFAFIDAEHKYDNAKIDFECVKKCGRVLFHDYSDGFPGIKRFVDELPKNEITVIEPFAYWERNGNFDG